MTYHPPQIAPASTLAEDRRGLAAARFCRSCQEFYPLHRGSHFGKPLYGKDHISSPCSHQGEAFVEGAEWWETAVQILPVAAAS